MHYIVTRFIRYIIRTFLYENPDTGQKYSFRNSGCDDRFLEIDRDQQELKVEINERKMFPKRIIKPTRVDPLDALLEALDELSDCETSVGENIVE